MKASTTILSALSLLATGAQAVATPEEIFGLHLYRTTLDFEQPKVIASPQQSLEKRQGTCRGSCQTCFGATYTLCPGSTITCYNTASSGGASACSGSSSVPTVPDIDRCSTGSCVTCFGAGAVQCPGSTYYCYKPSDPETCCPNSNAGSVACRSGGSGSGGSLSTSSRSTSSRSTTSYTSRSTTSYSAPSSSSSSTSRLIASGSATTASSAGGGIFGTTTATPTTALATATSAVAGGALSGVGARGDAVVVKKQSWLSTLSFAAIAGMLGRFVL